MKRIKILASILIFLSIFISFCNYAVAVEDYVGVKEDDVFIWEYTYDDDVMEDYYEDYSDYLGKYVYGNGFYDFSSAIEISAGLYQGLSLVNSDDEDLSGWQILVNCLNPSLSLPNYFRGQSHPLRPDSP